MPQIPQNKQPKLNLQNHFSDKEQLKVSLRAVKIEELGLKKPIFPNSNPANPSQFDDLKEVSNSLKKVLVSLYDNGPKEPPRTLPKMGVNFSIDSNTTKLVSQKSMSVSNSLEPKKFSHCR